MHTMYIHRAEKKSPSGKIYRSVLLQHSYREEGKTKHKTIINLSKWTEKEIESLNLVLKGKRGYEIGDFKTNEGKAIGGLLVFKALAKKAGLLKMLGNSKHAKLALLLIIARILTQGSRRSLCEWVKRQEILGTLGIEGVKTDDLYKTLDWLAENQDKMEANLFASRKKKTLSLYLYDVTSSYLEGDKNELAEWGYNRDGKKGKKQIVIGLLTDEEGVPVTIEVFKGNTSDTQTVESQVNKCVDRFKIENITFVGDRGMVKKPQKELLKSKSYNFISAITRAQIQKLIKEGTFQLGLFENELVDIEEGEDRYILRRNPIRKKEIQDNREDKLKAAIKYKEKLNLYLNAHPKACLNVALEKLGTYLKKLSIQAWCEGVTSSGRVLKIQIDEEKKKVLSDLDGCYAIHTDIKKSQVSKENIHARYKDLSFVETAFRTLKTGCLEIRPLFVRKDSRTRGHVFVSMLSYILVQSFWRSVKHLGHSLEYSIDLIQSIQTINVQLGEKSVTRIPSLLPEKKALLEALAVKLPETI